MPVKGRLIALEDDASISSLTPGLISTLGKENLVKSFQIWKLKNGISLKFCFLNI